MTSIENHPEKNIIRVQLRQNNVLKGMSAESFEELERHLTVVDCHKGDFLLHQGVHEMEQYFILDGVLKRVVANPQAQGDDPALCRRARHGDQLCGLVASRRRRPTASSR